MATLYSNIPGLVRQMRANAARAARRTAEGIEADIRASMEGPKSGQPSGPGDVTSAPGEAPAVDSGSYAGTFGTAAVDETAVAVGTTDERGPLLELGGEEIEARPHVVPAFERAGENFESALGTIFEG